MADSAEKSFNEQQRLDIQRAIAEAEKNTSGEIRLFIEDTCKEDVLDRAAFIFKELKMHETADRNGVLFYLAMKSQKFAILGDAGINEKVGNDFWNEIKRTMLHHFSTGQFTEGLDKGIRMAGEALSKHFPYKGGDDVNELSDEIVFGK
jgi:uncharacterized membrane protein